MFRDDHLTRARDIRAAFWRDHPNLSRRQIPDYAGNGTMYCTDTRVAFSDYVDALARDGRISARLAQSVSLSEV